MTTPVDHSHAISNAKLDWDNEEPISQHFDDVYFSKAGGMDETHYVFLQHNNLPERWKEMPADSDFCIAETGFGTGLNFLCASENFLKNASSQARLHYISYEKYPLAFEDISKALANWPQLAEISNELLERYPFLSPGFHTINITEGRIKLTLVFGDINHYLPLTRASVDAWFLDGFAPAKNPEMWTDTLFTQMSRLSHTNTSFATFTAAGIVKRGLLSAGFHVNKVPGYGRKREMLAGHYKEGQSPKYSFKDKPWFIYPFDSYAPNKQIIVIGGGLAGCQSAWAMAQRGYQVILIERQQALAQEASGNIAGVIYGKFSAHCSAQYRFYQQAYLHALTHIPNIMKEADSTAWQQCGVLQLAHDDAELKLHRNLQQENLWPTSVLHRVTVDEASHIAGTKLGHPGLYFPQGGWLRPAVFCEFLSQHRNISILRSTEALTLKQQPKGWEVKLSTGKVLTSDSIIIANAADAMGFEQSHSLPLKKIRGQVSHVTTPNNNADNLKTVICHKGYITPAINNIFPIGATFNLRDDERELRNSDHQTNFDHLRNYLPELADQLKLDTHELKDGRVGFRCQTPDYLPIVGPVADKEAYIGKYQNLLTGLKHGELSSGSYYPGLYINVAHGSRGITNSGLAAEILASYINNEPSPVDQEVLNALHPARFIIRSIKRRKT